MAPNFTPEAHTALRRAARDAEQRGDPWVTPDHLLLVLLQGKDTNAARLLVRSRITPEPLGARLERYLSWADHTEHAEIRRIHTRKADGASVGEMLPRTGQVLNHAVAEARRQGCAVVGTEHLLFGVLREAGSVGSWLLWRAGLHPITLSEELATLLPETETSGKYRVEASISAVRALNAVNTLAALGYLWGLHALLTLSEIRELPNGQLLWPSFLHSAWAAGLALNSVRAGLRLERRVWPRMQALLFTASAGAAGLLTAAITGLAPSLDRATWILMLYLPLAGYAAVTLFRARTWFGVETREGWRTLWREGGVYLIVSAILELATLASHLRRD